MDTVSVFDAKNRLSALLDEVEQGGEITITRRGKPVARLVGPANAPGSDGARAAAAGLLELRRAIAAETDKLFTAEEIKSFRDEGRR